MPQHRRRNGNWLWKMATVDARWSLTSLFSISSRSVTMTSRIVVIHHPFTSVCVATSLLALAWVASAHAQTPTYPPVTAPLSAPAHPFPLGEIVMQEYWMHPRHQVELGDLMKHAIEHEVRLRQTQAYWQKRLIHAESVKALDRVRWRTYDDAAAVRESLEAWRIIASMQRGDMLTAPGPLADNLGAAPRRPINPAGNGPPAASPPMAPDLLNGR